MSKKMVTICTTTRKNSSFDYETLVRFMLSNGILAYFEITKIEEEVTEEKDETGTVIRILHIYLDERDLRSVAWHDLQPNGFTEPRLFNDSPLARAQGAAACPQQVA